MALRSGSRLLRRPGMSRRRSSLGFSRRRPLSARRVLTLSGRRRATWARPIVRSVIARRAETKYKDSNIEAVCGYRVTAVEGFGLNFGPSPGNAGQAGRCFDFCVIQTGTDFRNRIGAEIFVKSLHISVTFNALVVPLGNTVPSNTEASIYHRTIFRWALVEVVNDVLPAEDPSIDYYPRVFSPENTSQPAWTMTPCHQWPYNQHTASGQYRVLDEGLVHLDAETPYSTLVRNWAYNKKVKYSATTATAAARGRPIFIYAAYCPALVGSLLDPPDSVSPLVVAAGRTYFIDL